MNPLFKFEDAKRVQCKASIMIEGLTGKGKSGLALILGHALAGNDWSKVSAIDTENRSLTLFADIPSSLGENFGKFKVGQLTKDVGFKPTNYVAFREVAKQNGAEVCIKDSISHAWQYAGGVLDLVSQAKNKSTHYSKDKYAVWGDEDVVREKNELLSLIRDDKIHVITTVRVKEKFEYGTDDKGKTTLVSLGEQQIQQADLKYEPDLVLHMLKAGSSKSNPVAQVIKSRYAILTEGEAYEFTPELIQQIKEYLEEGVSPEVLLERQKEDYVKAVSETLDSKKSLVPIWSVMKEDAGYKDVKLADMPLDIIKSLFIKLTSE